jgi:hypothetical protein
MRPVEGHGVAIHESSRIEHAKATAFKSRLLRGRVPRHSKEVEDRIDGFHGRFRRVDFTRYRQSIALV